MYPLQAAGTTGGIRPAKKKSANSQRAIGRAMDTLVPWKVQGWYEHEDTVGDDDHVAAHVDFGSVTYEYK